MKNKVFKKLAIAVLLVLLCSLIWIFFIFPLKWLWAFIGIISWLSFVELLLIKFKKPKK